MEQTLKRAEQDLMQKQSETPRPVVGMVATAYGVQHSLQLEQKLEVLQRQVHGGARGMPSAWRRASEVERKLNAARETGAAARVQVAMLRGESKRKGQRIAQLQALIDDLEKDNRALRARLSAEGQGSIEKPLPGFAATAVDTCLNAAVRASERLLAAGLGDIRRPGVGMMPRRRDLNGGVFFAGNDAGGEVEDEEGARGAASHAPPLVGKPPVAVWSAELWVRSLQLEELVVPALLRHVHSATSLVPAELPFLCGLGAHTNAHSVVLALLREGTLLERLADRLAAGAVKMHNERSRLFSPSPFPASSSTLTSVAMALRSVHPLRLHRLAHTLSDLAPAPATHDLATLEALFTPAPTDEQVALHAIREEHTAGADAKLRFTADDLAEPTFALAEYWFVADPINGLKSAGLVEWPPFHSRRAAVPVPSEPYHPTTLSAATARTIPRKGKTWAQLSPAVQEVNARLAELGHAPLSSAERIAARLFTGPMGVKYDALLKHATHPSADNMRRCDELCAGNGYRVTLALLHSTLSRLALLGPTGTPLYRTLTCTEAAAVWRAAASNDTCSAGALGCVVERSAALAVADVAALAIDALVHRAGEKTADAPWRRDGEVPADPLRSLLGKLEPLLVACGDGGEANAAGGRSGGGGSSCSGGSGGGGGASAASTSAATSAVTSAVGSAILRIETPSNQPIAASLIFLSQRPLPECNEVTLLPLTPLRLTAVRAEASVLVLVATAGVAYRPTRRPTDGHSMPLPRVGGSGTSALAAFGSWPGGSDTASAPTMDQAVTRALDATRAAAPRSLLPPKIEPPPPPVVAPAEPEPPGELLEEASAVLGTAWCATRTENAGCCVFWFHLPSPSGTVVMRWRPVGSSRWMRHAASIQVLPGGWWRTGEWDHAGDSTYEQGCWVGDQCVMMGIRGPPEYQLLPPLPPGTAPPSPHGTGRVDSGGRPAPNESASPSIPVRSGSGAAFSGALLGLGRAESTGSGAREGASAAMAGSSGGAGACGGVEPSNFAGDVPVVWHDPPPSLATASSPSRTPARAGADQSDDAGARAIISERLEVSLGPQAWGGQPQLLAGESGYQTAVEQQQQQQQRRRTEVELSQRMDRSASMRFTGMMWHGLRYTRIWSLQAPGRGSAGGGFDLPIDAIMHLAETATSIHIRIAGDESESVTLKPGVVWPLQQLRRGLPFDKTLHGVDVTPAIARVTWHGPPACVERLWNKGVDRHRESETLRQGRLYLGCGNPNGLHLVAGQHCDFSSGGQQTGGSAVEVWLGEPPEPLLDEGPTGY